MDGACGKHGRGGKSYRVLVEKHKGKRQICEFWTSIIRRIVTRQSATSPRSLMTTAANWKEKRKSPTLVTQMNQVSFILDFAAVELQVSHNVVTFSTAQWGLN